YHMLCRCYLPPFPTRRSSDLHLFTQSDLHFLLRLLHFSLKIFGIALKVLLSIGSRLNAGIALCVTQLDALDLQVGLQLFQGIVLDRKSTRLNSSHLVTSYAVF